MFIICRHYILDNAIDGSIKRIHIRWVLGGDAVHGADQPAVGAAADPGAGRGPHLPRPHLLLQALRQARRALPRIRAHLPRLAHVLTHR